MNVSTLDWRGWLKGFAANDLIISFIGIVFCAFTLLYLYDLGSISDSKNILRWAIFAAVLVYIFVLIMQQWLSFMVIKETSAGYENIVMSTNNKSQFWRDFSLFHIGYYTLFFCLDLLWAPGAAIFKLLIVGLVCYRLVCYAVAHFFFKYQYVQQREVEPPACLEGSSF